MAENKQNTTERACGPCRLNELWMFDWKKMLSLQMVECFFACALSDMVVLYDLLFNHFSQLFGIKQVYFISFALLCF